MQAGPPPDPVRPPAPAPETAAACSPLLLICAVHSSCSLPALVLFYNLVFFVEKRKDEPHLSLFFLPQPSCQDPPLPQVPLAQGTGQGPLSRSSCLAVTTGGVAVPGSLVPELPLPLGSARRLCRAPERPGSNLPCSPGEEE